MCGDQKHYDKILFPQASRASGLSSGLESLDFTKNPWSVVTMYRPSCHPLPGQNTFHMSFPWDVNCLDCDLSLQDKRNKMGIRNKAKEELGLEKCWGGGVQKSVDKVLLE